MQSNVKMTHIKRLVGSRRRYMFLFGGTLGGLLTRVFM